MKRTAVEWLKYVYENQGEYVMDDQWKNALEMEKEQIVEAVNTTIKGIRVDKQRKGFFVVNGEGYYASTYEANKND